MGVASMRFFDENGSLVMGLQKRPFRFTDKMPFSWDPAAPPSGREPEEGGSWYGSDVVGGVSRGDRSTEDDATRKADWGFQLERVRIMQSLACVVRGDSYYAFRHFR